MKTAYICIGRVELFHIITTVMTNCKVFMLLSAGTFPYQRMNSTSPLTCSSYIRVQSSAGTCPSCGGGRSFGNDMNAKTRWRVWCSVN